MRYFCPKCNNQLPADITKECPCLTPPVKVSDTIVIHAVENDDVVAIFLLTNKLLKLECEASYKRAKYPVCIHQQLGMGVLRSAQFVGAGESLTLSTNDGRHWPFNLDELLASNPTFKAASDLP